MVLKMLDLTEYQKRLDMAIKEVKPEAINCLFSGGYDSMIATHIAHKLNTHGIPLNVWAADTNLAADGWHEFVTGVANGYGWNFQIYNNKFGFLRFLVQVVKMGLPVTKSGHKFTMQKLKGVAFEKIHMLTKAATPLSIPPHLKQWQSKEIYKFNGINTTDTIHNKTLFITGMRREESPSRQSIPILQRRGTKNFYWLALIADFSESDCYNYRLNNDLPDNPFYDTVKGSGDCQCNWGLFIVYETLKRYSPNLAAGNVAIIDAINRYFHGVTWDGKSTRQAVLPMLDNYNEPCQMTSPFLCQGCSRQKSKPTKEALEKRYFQTSF